MPIDPWLSHLLLECVLCYSFKENKADLPTPKSEKTGGGLKKNLQVEQKTWRFCKNVTWLNYCTTVELIKTSYFLVSPALRCRSGLDSSELSAEFESSSTCNTVSRIHAENPPWLVKFSYVGKHVGKAQPARLVPRPSVTLRTAQWKPKRKMSRVLLRKPRRVFRLPTSNFWFPTFDFQLPTSVFRLPTPVAMKGDGRPARLLRYAKMVLVPKTFFFSFCWVDYALEGSG